MAFVATGRFFRTPRRVALRLGLTVVGAPLAALAIGACSPGTSGATARADSAATRAAGAERLAQVDTQRVALNVQGMYCESCESTVAAMLRRTPGVFRADVSVERSEAVIVYDSVRTSPAKLVDVIATLGYSAAVKSSQTASPSGT